MAQNTENTQSSNNGAPQFQTSFGIEIWVSDTEGGTYVFLTSVGAGLGEQVWTHSPLIAGTTKWYKLRYRTALGYSTFAAARKGITSTTQLIAVPSNNASPEASA